MKLGAYDGVMGPLLKRETVNHSAGEYVSDDGLTTNGIESVWAVLKRGVYGTFHHVSPKHLGRYVDEFTFRLNERALSGVAHARPPRLASLDGVAGRAAHLQGADPMSTSVPKLPEMHSKR